MFRTAEELKETIMIGLNGCCGKLSAGLFLGVAEMCNSRREVQKMMCIKPFHDTIKLACSLWPVVQF